MAKDLQYPSRFGAPGSINAYTLDGGFTPQSTHFLLTHPATSYSPATDRLHYYAAALETKAPAGTGGQPRQYAAVARSIFRLDSGTITDDLVNFQSTNDAFNDVVQGAVIFDIPSITDVTSFTQGTAGLIVAFGSGNPDPGSGRTGFFGVYYRSLSTDSAPWAVNGDASRSTETTKGTTYLTCWQMVKAGPDLYAACDAGVAGALGDYRVSKCPAGNNPILVASWGNGIEVGSPEWIVNGLAAIGDAPVAGKADGLYYWNGQTRRYENVLKHFEITPHALNGKVTASVQDGVVYTTFDGGAFLFDGVSTTEISPYKLWKMLGKDVPSSRITAVADRGDSIIMVPEVGYQTTQQGLQVRVVSAALAATDVTADVIDGSLATGTGTALDSLASGSFIDVWAPIPFEAVQFHVTRSPNSTAATVFDQVLYSSANDTFTAYAGFRDGTRLTGKGSDATAGGSLSYVAFPPSASAGLIIPTDVNAGALMQAVTFNYASGTDISTPMYGMRFRTSGIMDADVETDEIEIVPFRPGLPNETLLTATTNFTPRYRSNMVQRVYSLRRKGSQFVPHEITAMNTYGATWAVSAHAGRLGQPSGGQNMGQPLIFWGRYTTAALSEGPTRNPSKDLYQITVQHSSTKPGPVWQFLYDWDAGDRTRMKRIERVLIDTLFLEPTDAWEAFFQYDQRDIVKVGYGKGGPIVFDPPQTAVRLMQGWIVLQRGQVTNERAPQLLEPVKLFYEFEDDIQAVQDTARPTPLVAG